MTDKPVALIVGGGSGIGADAARNLAERGYDVGVMSSSGKGEVLGNELGGLGFTGSNLVVADLEKEARALIDFIGLEWDDACLDFHKNERTVHTASVAQVRQPIYKTSVERWVKFGDALKPLKDIVASDLK